jgi:hypothetical protein
MEGIKITLGSGAGDTVSVANFDGGVITLGNGDGDVVKDDSLGYSNAITVGTGNDTIYVGNSDTVTVGTGQEEFVFEQTTPGSIGAVSINGFDPSRDVIAFSSQLTTSVSYQDNAQGNAVITPDNGGDTITLVGVHASALLPSDFQFINQQIAQLTQAAATFAPTDPGPATGLLSQGGNDASGPANVLASPQSLPHTS